MSVRHYSCKLCGAEFNDRSNKYRHEVRYCKINKDKKKIEVKVKVKAKGKMDPDISKQLLEELKDLRQRVKQIENEPRYNNWIIVGADMFNDMINKYGRSEAINFLTKSAISGDSVDVIKKLYLDGVSPEKYPIACKNYHHFRYLNDKHEVIDDQGGISVQKIFSDRAHRAMLLATNEMIKDRVINDVECEDDVLQQFGAAQCRLTVVHSLNIERLAGMTHNPNHPFFC